MVILGVLAVLVGLLILASLVLIVFRMGAIVSLIQRLDDRGSSDSYTLSQENADACDGDPSGGAPAPR